ncbi:MAG: tryptophan--tRNA ligase, partial [Stenotrophomonas koreensis]
LPEAVVDENVATLAGLDGRKMSKSYHNTIPLFSSRDELKKLIAQIVTDSRAPGEPKDTEGSALFQLYQAFATPAQTAAFAQAFADGIGWGDAKAQLLEVVDGHLAPMRERYNALMAEPEKIEALLRRRGAQLRERFAIPLLRQLRDAVGLRDLSSVGDKPQQKAASKAVLPSFKQYREADGQFYFKLLDGQGDLLLQSSGYPAPRDAGQRIAGLKQATDVSALDGADLQLQVPAEQVLEALALMREAD